MPIYLISAVFLGCSIIFYLLYLYYLRKKNQAFFTLSKRADWVEPIVTTPEANTATEMIVDEMMSAFLEATHNDSLQSTVTLPTQISMQNSMSNAEKSIKSLYVMALPGQIFQGYELLQAMAVNHLHYGTMQIFHRYTDENTATRRILFSVANALEPGFFTISEMGALTCPGLILFMQGDKTADDRDGFSLMLETAKQLADDLGGQVLDENHNPIENE